MKFLLKICPVDGIKGNSLSRDALLCVHNEITPGGSSDPHVALHLCKVRMSSFEFALSIYSLTEKIKILACI